MNACNVIAFCSYTTKKLIIIRSMVIGDQKR